MVMDACRSATGGGEGVEWLQEEENPMLKYDNTDGHMTCDVPGYSPPKNKGVFTLKQFNYLGST
ncbi:phosphatidylinositol transfer protein beta isoform [Blastocystis sp. subtype 4]|uniref:phosphatidylinositol transfer protein beta isoform n=1 Tax=Blastocystis sp. subtype 4 TaxID=944170 RepID=UPI0007117FEE|nr:phosphatidylinositol transfer protein beta isoform [Blastocystis sp. subtype 4]KNB42171.1 phosphatidylinositol transfer protein beta isoform [Blastocystis sp. subtype 4]|eukprot:XP_014525614.1 phosphatidylinositol transfer protein beta isoform [Blastocystis sp. subtype 4]